MILGKRITMLFLTGMIAISSVGCGAIKSNEKRVVRIAHAQNEDHPEHKALVEFEKYVEKNTDGKIDIQIFPNELLGPQPQSVELTQTGAVDLALVGLGVLEGFEESYTVFNLPYVMDSKEHYHSVMNDKKIIDPIFESTRKSGFIGLTWFDAGVRNIYTTNKAIMKPEDMKGLKIRVQTSPTNVKMLQALGASPTPMAFGEVYTGLQQKVIDGAENNELALINNKHGEVAKNYSYNMHAMLPDILIMNADLMNKLTKKEQKVFREGAKYINEFEVKAWEVAASEAKEKAEKLGVKFYYPNIKPFQDKMGSLHAEYTQKENMKKIYDQIRAKGDEIIKAKQIAKKQTSK